MNEIFNWRGGQGQSPKQAEQNLRDRVEMARNNDKAVSSLFETFRGNPEGTTLPLHRYDRPKYMDTDHQEEPLRDPYDLLSMKQAAHEARIANNQRSVVFHKQVPDSPFYQPGNRHQIREPVQGSYVYAQPNHLPSSPLYRPGDNPQGTTSPQFEPRGVQPQSPLVVARKESPEVPPLDVRLMGKSPELKVRSPQPPTPKSPEGGGRNEGPPTPNYNATHLRFDDTASQEGQPPGRTDVAGYVSKQREWDIRDFRGNVMRGRGNMTDRGNITERGGGGGQERLDMPDVRKQPWLQSPTNTPFDPRMGQGAGGYSLGVGGGRNGGALLFIRFPSAGGENLPVAAHAFLKAKVHDNGGRYLGMARKVYDFGYEHHQPDAVGVYHFPTMDKALLFFQLDTILRQPDFPPPYGHAQMWIICNAYLPDNMDLFSTFLLSEIELHPGKDKRTFFEEFQVKFERYLYANGAMPFVVCSYGPHDRQSIRRHAYTHKEIVTCHLFQGLDHLKWLTAEEQYCKFRSLHNQMALEKCSIFTLSRAPLK